MIGDEIINAINSNYGNIVTVDDIVSSLIMYINVLLLLLLLLLLALNWGAIIYWCDCYTQWRLLWVWYDSSTIVVECNESYCLSVLYCFFIDILVLCFVETIWLGN